VRPRLPAGFSLLEVLAVVLLTSIVIGVALSHYVNLSRASQRATLHTRDIRRATALLDRVARDFESVLLVARSPEQDPLDHPWIFLGEARYSLTGADHLKFMTRGREVHGDDVHESDFQVVTYALRSSEDDRFELMRWSSPRLPEGLDREIPEDESDGAVLLAGGLASFGVSFIDEGGEQVLSWDSSQLVESGELPREVEIEVALADTEGVPRSFRRRVILPVRPLDMRELFDPRSLVSGGPGGEGEEPRDKGDEDEPLEDPICIQTNPCAKLLACDAIGCSAKMGQYGASMDQLLERTLAAEHTVCQFLGYARNYRWLIDNPACR